MAWNLTLRFTPVAQRAATAWLVPGDDAGMWLDALAQFAGDARRVRLVAVPQSSVNRSPLGALIWDLDGRAPKAQHMPGHFQPYGCRAGRLYLPVEAEIFPPVSDAELESLLSDDQVYIWHPAAGLIAYAEQQWLTLASLLAAPDETPADWNRAICGTAYNQRLVSMTAAHVPTLETLMSEAREDIGSQAANTELLPRSPREAFSGIPAQMGRSVLLALARGVLGVAGLLSPIVRFVQRIWGSRAFRLFAVAALAGALLYFFMRQQPTGGSGAHTPPPIASQPDTPPPAPHAHPPGFPSPTVPFSSPFSILPNLLGLLVVVWWGLIALQWFFRLLWPALAAVGSWIRRRLPEQPRVQESQGTQSGWFARLTAWARAKVAAIEQSLQAARHRELERLLPLLDGDPDEGLRFALPLAGDLGRGIAPASNRLSSRTVDYRAGGGRSGGPADYWDIREEYRRKLTTRYRELANREIALGRHRRAAYILAELLGDWHAAANALRDGGHYREAAVIYDERLKRPLDAAECLQRGGLVDEAIVIYERLKMHETIGDLCTSVERTDDAQRAYRLAIKEKRDAGDPLGAARLLEDKLHLPEEAWQEIADGWPHSPQAEKCLSEAFAWTRRHHDPDRAQRHVQHIAGIAQLPEQVIQVVTQTAELAVVDPEPAVRAIASSTTLRLASPRLPFAAEPELRALTAAVRRLAAEDRLLSHDCDRYARQQLAVAPPRPAPLRVEANQLELRLQAKFPFGNVRACVASLDTIYAAGWREQSLLIARADWSGRVHYPDGSPWTFPEATVNTPISLAVNPVSESVLCVHALSQSAVGFRRTFPYTGEFRREVVAGDFANCRITTLAIAGTSDGFVAVHVAAASLIVNAYAVNGTETRLVDTCELPLEVNIDLPLPFEAREGNYYFALETSLCTQRRGAIAKVYTFQGEIKRLIASRPYSRPRLIAVFDHGAEIVWGLTPNSSTTRFAEDLEQPQVLLHPKGFLIAADRRRCEVYRTEGSVLRLHAAAALEDLGEIVAILPAPLANVFAVVDSSGHMRQFRFPGVT